MRSKSIFKLVITSLFVAITFLFGMTPIGLIPLGMINVTILCLPVIIGALYLGWKEGLILGAVFGLCSTLSVFGLTMTVPSGLAAALNARSPALLIVMNFVPRLLVPIVAYFVYRVFTGKNKTQKILPLPLAAVLGSLTNTFIYISLMIVFYRATGLDISKPMSAFQNGAANAFQWFADITGIEMSGFIASLREGTLSTWALILAIGGGAGGLEAVAAGVIVPPIVTALWKTENRLGRSTNK